MSRLTSSIENLKAASQGLRQEWANVRPMWKANDRDQWERKYIRMIEDVLGQQLVRLQELNETFDQAHREVL